MCCNIHFSEWAATTYTKFLCPSHRVLCWCHSMQWVGWRSILRTQKSIILTDGWMMRKACPSLLLALWLWSPHVHWKENCWAAAEDVVGLCKWMSHLCVQYVPLKSCHLYIQACEIVYEVYRWMFLSPFSWWRTSRLNTPRKSHSVWCKMSSWMLIRRCHWYSPMCEQLLISDVYKVHIQGQVH